MISPFTAAAALALATAASSSAPAPYSLPWQLRPAVVATVVRSDTAQAFFHDAAGNAGQTTASTLLVSYRVLPELAPFVRLAVVGNFPPTGAAAASFVNPVVGAFWASKPSPDLRLAAMLGVTIPAGMGGGDAPPPATAAATRSGILARSALDNALFAVNDFTIIPGVDLAWVAHGFTVQLEATLLQLIRVRGAAVQPDAFKTNLTSGLHVAYFVLPQLSLGAELRYQRWLSTPAAVAADPTGAQRDTLSFAAGARGHFKLSDSLWFRPGLAYAHGLDDPMNALGYQIVQVDLPLVF
jgi:hypothetical protein